MKPTLFERLRTAVLLAVGIFVIMYETVVSGTDRPALLIVGLMLCGFPIVINLDKVMRGVIKVEPADPPPARESVKEESP